MLITLLHPFMKPDENGTRPPITLGIHTEQGYCDNCDDLHQNIYIGFGLFTIMIML